MGASAADSAPIFAAVLSAFSSVAASVAVSASVAEAVSIYYARGHEAMASKHSSFTQKLLVMVRRLLSLLHQKNNWCGLLVAPNIGTTTRQPWTNI